MIIKTLKIWHSKYYTKNKTNSNKLIKPKDEEE